jgi:hypothetical protein
VGRCKNTPVEEKEVKCYHRFSPQVHATVYAVGSSIMKKTGLGGFFIGLFPAAVQVAPYTGLQFGFYSFFSRVFVQEKGDCVFLQQLLPIAMFRKAKIYHEV